MKKIELSEARAMLKEILAVNSASHESIAAVLKLGRSPVDGRLHGFGELSGPFKAIAEAADSVDNGIISIDDNAWTTLQGVYYNRVTKHVLF